MGVEDVSGAGVSVVGSGDGVCVGVAAGAGVFVAMMGVEISVDDTVAGIPVGAGEGVWVGGREADVETNETGSCVPLEPFQLKWKNKKINNKIMATTNLNRS